MNVLRALDIGGAVIMALLLVVGITFVVSGFRFISPLDTVFRFFFGGVCVLWSGAYLHRCYRVGFF